MQNKTVEYTEGYAQCMKDFEEYLNESILRNGGAVTGIQAFNVMSEIALWTHHQVLKIRELTRTPKETFVSTY